MSQTGYARYSVKKVTRKGNLGGTAIKPRPISDGVFVLQERI